MGALAILYGIQAAAGAGQAIFGMQQANQARAQEALLRAQGLPKMQTPQEYFDLYQNASRSRAFEQEKAMTESIMASNLNVLASAGSRALIGAAPGVALQAQRGLAGAAERDFQRQQQALQTLAGAEGRTEAYNFQAQSRQYAADLARAQAGYQAGLETAVSGAEQAIGAGFMAGQEVADARGFGPSRRENLRAVANTPDTIGRGVDVTEMSNESVIGQERGLVTGGPSAGPALTADALAFQQQQEMLRQQALDYDDLLLGGADQPARRSVAQADPMSAFPFGGEPADLQPYARRRIGSANPLVFGVYPPLGRAEGGSVTTPGKYTADHSLEYDVKTKGGKTIATVTGDETLVFNPEQRRFLKKVIGKLMTGGTIKPTKADVKAANKTLKAFKK